MKSIPLSSLIIPENRQRRLFDPKKLEELSTSIMTKGLLHPPVVRFTGEEYILVAGERRTRAVTSLASIDVGVTCNGEEFPAGHLPITLLSDLSDFAIREAELEENTIREDLTWAEKARAIAELDSLRKDQAAATGQTHTFRDTASEIVGRLAEGGEITKVTEAVIVAKHLHDPEVAAAKTQKEAVKIIKKKAAAAHRAVLAQTFDIAKTPHKLVHASAFDFLPTLPAASVDVILTDPPYGINADAFGSMADTVHAYADSPDYAEDCYKLVAEEGFRVTRPQAHCYVFLDPRMWNYASLAFTAAGWDVWPTPLIWAKGNGMLPKPEHGPRRTYEMILFANKGSKKVLKVAADVIPVPLSLEREHGAQKPVLLYRELLSRSALPGQTVLDPFAGSGTIFPAANAEKLVAVASELSQEYHDLALSRIDATDDISDLLPGGLL
jgi:site-specific DNA-methyltransferase (adenine-specific)